jgi:predicted ATPase
MGAAVARHDALLLKAIGDNSGYVFSQSGDGIAASFGRAHQAVAAALQAQFAIVGVEWEVPAFRVRMAVHTGEAEERDGNYFGPTLNEAGRLLGSGHGGQVLISGATREVLGVQLSDGAGLRDLGEHRLRDVGRLLRVFQLIHPRLEEDFPPLRTEDPGRAGLPIQVTSLVGRHEELAKVEKLLGDGRLLTLIGAGGCGKTRLAVETASRWKAGRPGAVWFVDLTPVSEPDLVKSTVIRAMGMTESNDADALERLLEFVRARQGLLVLDNCEHVRDEVGLLVAALLRAAPSVTVLATSREALGLQGEVVWDVPPLPIPALDTAASDLLRFDSVRLFEARAAAAQPGFSITAANADAVRRICRRLDGIPLGVELAAARLRVISPDDLARRLEDSLAVLGSAGRDVVPHHRTLEATLEWSYQLLGAAEQALLARLAVFAGGWTLEAAEEIGRDGSLGSTEVLDVLSSLIDKSLVVVADGSLGVRYRLLEPIRQYAKSKLLLSGAGPETRQRHAAYFGGLAEMAFLKLIGRDEGVWLDRLEVDIDNLREALTWHLDTGEVARGQLMAGALHMFWGRTHRDEEALDWQERLLAADTKPGSPRARALLLSTLHPLEAAQAHHARLEEAVALYRESGPERELIMAIRIWGLHSDATGAWQTAVKLFEEALLRARALGDVALVTLAATDLASIQIRWVEDLVTPAPLIAEAVAAARSLGSPMALHNALVGAADLEESRGDLSAASALLVEALELERSAGTRLGGVGVALTRLAEIALVEGRLDVGLAYLADQYQQIQSLSYGEARTRDPLRRESLRIRGEIEVGRGHFKRGVTLLASHSATFGPQRLEKLRQDRFDAALDRARAALGDEEFTSAWNEGTAMSLERALRYGADDSSS